MWLPKVIFPALLEFNFHQLSFIAETPGIMSSAKNSKRSQGSSALERTRAVSDDDVESLIDRVTQGVLARLDKAVQESMDRHIQRAVSEIRSEVEDE